jgi:hypothetical protein
MTPLIIGVTFSVAFFRPLVRTRYSRLEFYPDFYTNTGIYKKVTSKLLFLICPLNTRPEGLLQALAKGEPLLKSFSLKRLEEKDPCPCAFVITTSCSEPEAKANLIIIRPLGCVHKSKRQRQK